MNSWIRRATIAVVCGAVSALGLVAAGRSAATAAGPPLPSADPFYSYTGSLTDVAPGTVLRTRPVTTVEFGLKTPISATQMLYRTTGELGQPTVTVATVVRPLVSLGATKLVSYQMAYDALGPECDPSYTIQGGNPGYSDNAVEQDLIGGYVAAGYTAVVPDYEGTRLDWAAGQESGYGTLDGIRAAESLLSLGPASTPVGMIGYSGGSIATDFAAELAPTYAPNLDIVGTAIGGVPVDFAHNLAYINGSPDWSGVIPAVLVSLSRAFGVNLQRYLSPYGLKLAQTVSGQCINSFVGDYPGLTYQKLLKPRDQDIFAIPSLVRIVNRLIMSRTGTPKEPMLIGVGNADGTGDGVMIANDVEALAHTYCARGVPVQFSVYTHDTHVEAVAPFEAAALTFLIARLGGRAVANGCGGIGTGSSLAPLAVPAGAAKHHRRRHHKRRRSPRRGS